MFNIKIFFSKLAALFSIPNNSVRGLQFLHTLTYIQQCLFFIMASLVDMKRCLSVVLICILIVSIFTRTY